MRPGNRPPGRTRSLILAGLGVIVFAVIVAIPLMMRDIQDDPPITSGELWAAQVDGGAALVYVTREERSKSVPIFTESHSSRYEPYSRFELVVRRIPSGAVIATAPLGDLKDAGDGKAPDIIGIVGDVVWLWHDGLEARSLHDLAVKATTATLAGTGAESASDVLPNERKGYAVAPDPPRLVAHGRDARFYTIDATASSVEPMDPATLPPTTLSTRVEDRMQFLIPPSQARVVTHPYNAMQRSFLTSDGYWYALLSDSERSSLSRWPSGEDRPSGDVARSLYRTTYKLDDRRQPEIDPGSLTPRGAARLIQGGFLVRWQYRVWDVGDPSSSLVLAKQLLGSAEPWEVVRLARDGTVVWRTSTTLADPHELVDLGTHVVFLGREPAVDGEPVGERDQRIVWIDERSGARGALSVATGQVR